MSLELWKVPKIEKHPPKGEKMRASQVSILNGSLVDKAGIS